MKKSCECCAIHLTLTEGQECPLVSCCRDSVEPGVPWCYFQEMSLEQKLDNPREATMQEMLDCGINAFAAQLISESFADHPDPKPITFRYRNAVFHMRPVKPDQMKKEH